MVSAVPPTLFQHIVDNILFLNMDEIQILKNHEINSIRSIGTMSYATLTSMNFAHVIAITLRQFQAYIVYHKFNITTATWLNFDEDLWAQLPHHTFATSLSSDMSSIPPYPISISSSNPSKSITPTLQDLITPSDTPHSTSTSCKPAAYTHTHHCTHTPTSQPVKCSNIDTSLLLSNQLPITSACESTTMSVPTKEIYRSPSC